LTTCLEQLVLKAPAKKWQSVYSALRTVWSKGKIEEMSKRLDLFRQELALRILVLLNTKHDAQSSHQAETLERLERSNKDIIEIVSITNSVLGSFLQEHGRRDGSLDDTGTERRHEETIAAILTLRDGNTQTIVRPDVQASTTMDPVDPRRVQRSMTIKEGTEDVSLRGSGKPPLVLLRDFGPAETKILDCLHFRQITDRFEEVTDAHRRTFEWIYRDPVTDQNPWSNFVQWLQRGSGCYWINGKAGSGKSTLMKYILNNRSTKLALSTWAGQDGLCTPSFFFWHLGSAVQKSQYGLLRSLLFEVLSEQRHLIPSLFPRLCRSAVINHDLILSEPSFAEVKKAFSSLVQFTASPLKICFFIDGVDEYMGDHTEICELLCSVASSPSIKIVLSSRPIPACVEAFQDCAMLRLQDLTYDDIRLYVDDNLGMHRHMLRLKTQEQASATQLMAEISTKASGVFLWVMLVVRSLLRGRQNYDRVSDLRRRLEELPPDLEQLYKHMLETMTPLYRQQASQLFQIVTASIGVQEVQPLTLLQLSYADEEDISEVITAPIQPLPGPARSMRLEATEARLRSRCCGLIEVQEKRFRTEDGSLAQVSMVRFLHKTVAEFLQTTNVWDDILCLTSGSAFNPHVALLSSCLALAKIFCPSSPDNLLGEAVIPNANNIHCLGYLKSNTRNFFGHALVAEQVTAKAQTAYINEFNKTMASHWSEIQSSPPLSRQHPWTMSVSGDRLLLTLAIRYGLTLYLEESLISKLSPPATSELSFLLWTVIGQFALSNRNTQEVFKKLFSVKELPLRPVPNENFIVMAETLLLHGANPNEVIETSETVEACSSWELALKHALFIRDIHGLFLERFQELGGPSFAELLRLLIISGANPNTVQISSSKPTVYRRSALGILGDVFSEPTYLAKRNVPSASQTIINAHNKVITLLVERGAVDSQWEGDKVIRGPARKNWLQARSPQLARYDETPKTSRSPDISTGKNTARAGGRASRLRAKIKGRLRMTALLSLWKV
jgi:hypothetical protein